jgi:hypothetical protein
MSRDTLVDPLLLPYETVTIHPFKSVTHYLNGHHILNVIFIGGLLNEKKRMFMLFHKMLNFIKGEIHKFIFFQPDQLFRRDQRRAHRVQARRLGVAEGHVPLLRQFRTSRLPIRRRLPHSRHLEKRSNSDESC